MSQDIQDPREREIRRQFLDEAQAYWVTLEASVLGLAGQRVDLRKINAAMRAAHSIKGGAAMMGYQTLSEFAHRLEDSFKVLKTKQQSLIASPELEQWLLQGVDYLQRVIDITRQARAADLPSELQGLVAEATPLFDQLREALGEAEEETAASVLGSDDGGQALLDIVFSSEVEEVLLRLEGLLPTTADVQLRDEVMTIAGELGGLGEMLQLPSFTSLCESVLETLDQAERSVQEIAQAAQAAWRHAQTLVLAQQPSLIPAQLGLAQGRATGQSPIEPLPPVTPSGLGASRDVLPLNIASPLNVPALAVDSSDMAALASPPPLALVQEAQKLESETLPSSTHSDGPIQFEAQATEEAWPEPAIEVQDDEERTVRVSLRRVEQLNDLFGELTIERNALALYCDRLRSLTQLLKERVGKLDQNNKELHSYYNDLARVTAAQLSRGEWVAASGTAAMAAAPGAREHRSGSNGYPDSLGGHSRASDVSVLNGRFSSPSPLDSHRFRLDPQGFDQLEMDRYDSIGLQSQSVMETMVQVQEVTTDIDLSLADTDQTLRNLHKTTKHLRNQLTHLRMRPLTDVLDRFPRALRSLGLEHGKRVSLDLQGSNTLVDRNVLEALQEPLMHLLRNAFDHGLETPEERLSQGKPEEGQITIRAFQRGNRTLIEFQDDGRGIDIAKVRTKAAAMGLDRDLLETASDPELLSLIFEPGFSTRSEVTALSGRGVGMDVVRDRLKPVRGEITVTTQPGQGTTFTLAVPFSLAVLRVQVVESNGILLAIPADGVAEVILAEQLSEAIAGPKTESDPEAKATFTWNQQQVRKINLSPWLQTNCPRPPYSLEANPKIDCPALLLLSEDHGSVALEIERSWGEQEVAIRQIEGQIAMPPGFSNCSIMGDGRVIPLVNLVEIVQGQPPTSAQEGTGAPAIADTSKPASRLPTMPFESPSKPTVLVVDDSINVRRFLALTLEKAGYRVEQAKDGLQALEMLSAALPVQAIICDIEMPRLDGYGVLAKVKADPAMAHLPIAMLTSRSGEKHRKLAIDLGASAYFSKPYNEGELLKKLESMLVTA